MGLPFEPWRHERPWGSFVNLTFDEGWKCKRLTVNPGQAISLQRHLQRMEVWTVAAGLAHTSINGLHSVYLPGDTVTVPVGVIHRLENRSDKPLEVIEVQFGSYLGEDDIERFEDNYGRAGIP